MLNYLKTFPAEAQLNAILYHYQGSALICLVHTMMDNNRLEDGLEEFYKHNVLTEKELESIIENCQEQV